MLLSIAETNLTDTQSIIHLACGEDVLCKKLPGFLLRAFQRSHVEPRPPKKPVKVIGGMTTMEEDPNDPQHKKNMEAWTAQTGYDFLEIAMDYMELLDQTPEQEREREILLDRYGMDNTTPNRMDVFVFSFHDEDETAIYIKQLCDEIMRLSTITPTEVAEAKGNFRSEVDEHPGNRSEDAPNAS